MTSEKAPDLLPCPFCGGAALVAPDSEHSTAFTLTHHSKGCPIDDLWDWYPDINQAIAAWNTRAETAKDARIAELEAALKPFADAADEADEWGHDEHSVAAVSVGDCRIARAALTHPKPEGER